VSDKVLSYWHVVFSLQKGNCANGGASPPDPKGFGGDKKEGSD